VRLFEVYEITNIAMALQLQMLLEKIGLIHYVIAFVKDEGSDLGTMLQHCDLLLIVNL
jgi:hypothetical protein